MMYRVGLPFWRQLSRMGVTLKVRINAHYDGESESFWANSPDLDGMVVAGDTLDELRREAVAATAELLDLQLQGTHRPPMTDLRIQGTVSV